VASSCFNKCNRFNGHFYSWRGRLNFYFYSFYLFLSLIFWSIYFSQMHTITMYIKFWQQHLRYTLAGFEPGTSFQFLFSVPCNLLRVGAEGGTSGSFLNGFSSLRKSWCLGAKLVSRWKVGAYVKSWRLGTRSALSPPLKNSPLVATLQIIVSILLM
jgi:hypothetical protein